MDVVLWYDKVKKIACRPLCVQLIGAGFIVLIVWEFISGVVFFSHLNQLVLLHENTARESAVVMEQNETPSLLNDRLFGDYVPKNLDAAGIRQSTLNLIVVGVVLAASEKDSQVILQKPNGDERFFHIGDELPGGGTIKRITVEGVLVWRDGVLERLNLPKEELNFEPPAKPLQESAPIN